VPGARDQRVSPVAGFTKKGWFVSGSDMDAQNWLFSMAASSEFRTSEKSRLEDALPTFPRNRDRWLEQRRVFRLGPAAETNAASGQSQRPSRGDKGGADSDSARLSSRLSAKLQRETTKIINARVGNVGDTGARRSRAGQPSTQRQASPLRTRQKFEPAPSKRRRNKKARLPISPETSKGERAS
jgi:hypothetical protein